ncbi:MAG: tetratricopeptide repeat protein [Thermomicrobiales bacterium]
MAGDKPGPSRFGRLLRRLRKRADLTQEELAGLSGLSTRTISDQERGVKQIVQASTAVQLADALPLPLAEREAFLDTARETRRARRRPVHHVWAPVAPTPCIGRDTEIADIAACLRRPQTRLVTLTGPGGIGKSRLALAVGEALETGFEQLAYLNAMPLDGAAQLVPALASVLSRTGGAPVVAGSAWDQVVGALATQRALLLLDDLDCVPDAVTEIVELLATCPRLTILATSQAPLRIRAEQQVAIEPLPLPVSWQRDGWDAAPAVTLFMERAHRTQRGLEITPETAPHIYQICHASGGVPLALELAAAQLSAFPLPALAVAWPIGEPDDAPLLDLPPRQRSLAAAIRWSAAALPAREQQVFRHLAVFSGFSAEQAGAAMSLARGSVAGVLETLCARGLLQPAPHQRYVMLRPVQEVAQCLAEEAGEWDAAAEAHARLFCAVAERAETALSGAHQRRTRDHLDRDLPNLRTALAWGLRHDGDLALRIASALAPFWELQGDMTEGRQWLERALALPEPATGPAHVAALIAAAGLAEAQGDYATAIARHEQARPLLAALGDRALQARALNNYGLVLESQGDYPRAIACYEAALAINRDLGAVVNIANNLNNLGGAAYGLGDYAQALEVHTEALALRRQLGDDQGVIASLINLGVAHSGAGDDALSETLLNEALGLSRELGYLHGCAAALLNLSALAAFREDLPLACALTEEALAVQNRLKDGYMIAILQGNLAGFRQRQGDIPGAWDLAQTSLGARREMQDAAGIAQALRVLAEIALAQAEAATAARLLGHAQATLDAAGAETHPAERQSEAALVAALCAALGEARCAALSEEGRHATIEAVLAPLTRPAGLAGAPDGA